ncbi:MAG TPA: biotin/lipoyl-containing protein, partial [Steroidobacteraceae bacterium]
MSVELAIPDIGNFTDVDVVDVLVKPGDLIEVDTPLVTLETDKASMDVPSTAAGRVSEVLLKRGDKVSKGSLIARVEAGASASAAAPANTLAAAPANTATNTPAAAPANTASATSTGGPARAASTGSSAAAGATAPQADSGARSPRTPVRADAGDTVRMPSPQGRPPGETGGDAARSTELLVLGSGPGGYTAAFRAADLGLNVTLVERYADLGGVCLNVGCIPSKALLHAAKVIEDAQEMSARGIAFGAPQIDRAKLRTWKASVVTKLTGGLKVLARQRKVEVVRGVGRFAGPNVLEVRGSTGV